MKKIVVVLALGCAPVLAVVAQSTFAYVELMRLGRGTAHSLDWRPDGEVLAVGGSLGIWLYDADFSPLGLIETNEAVYRVAWSPDGERLAANGGRDSIHIWQVTADGSDSEIVQTLPDSSGFFSWNPDGERLVTSDLMSRDVTIWNAASGERLLEIAEATALAAWSPDGSKIAGSTGSEGVSIWDANTGEILQTFEGIEDDLYFGYVAWSPDGSMLAAETSLPTSLHVWDVQSGELVNDPVIGSDVAAIWRMFWSPDGDTLVEIGGLVESVRWMSMWVLDTNTWESINETGYGDGIAEAAWTPDGENLTTIGYGGIVRNWNPITDEVAEYPYFTIEVESLAWSPDGTRLASAGYPDIESTPIMIWDVATSENSVSYEPLIRFDGRHVWAIEWTPDGRELVETGWYGASLSNAISGELKKILFEHFEPDVPAPVVDWTSNLSLAAFTLWGGNTIEVREEFGWSLEEPLLAITAEEAEVTKVAWSPDDRQIVTVSTNVERDNIALEIWNAETGEQIVVREGGDWVREVLWSPDSSKLALITRNPGVGYVVETINAVTGETLATISDIYPEINWHPNGELLGIVEHDGVRLWDAETGVTVETFQIEGVNTLDWSPDGRRLALGMADGTIRIWEISG